MLIRVLVAPVEEIFQHEEKQDSRQITDEGGR